MSASIKMEEEEIIEDTDPDNKLIQLKCDGCGLNRLEVLYVLGGELYCHCLSCGFLQQYRIIIEGELV